MRWHALLPNGSQMTTADRSDTASHTSRRILMATVFEATKTSETREPGAHDIAGTAERATTDARKVGAQAVDAATQAAGTVIGTTRVSEAATRSLAATQTI